MKNKYMIIAVTVAAICGITGAGVLTASPDNYEDCVIKAMKGVESDRAASIIAKTCRQKFPKNVVYLTDEEVFGNN